MFKKYNAQLQNGEIVVNIKYFKDKEKTELLHEVTTAFPPETPEEVIREEAQKAGDLFVAEAKRIAEQVKIDQKFAKANETIKKLNHEPKEEKAQQ